MLNFCRLSKWALTGLGIMLLASQSALAKPWYITTDLTKTLYDFNNDGGGSTTDPHVVSPIAGDRIVGIDSLTNYGTLYAMTSKTDAGAVAGDNSLYTVNPATGAATLVGATGLSGIIEGDLGFDRTTGMLWGMFQPVTVGSSVLPGLYTINTTTGAATFAAGLQGFAYGVGSSPDPSGLAFDSSGQLWILNRNASAAGADNWRLLKVDKSDGSVSQNLDTGVSTSGTDTLGLDFDTDGNLFAALDNGDFYSVNTTTGAMTMVATHGLQATGLALVPEPSTWAMLATLPAFILAWIVWRRRRQSHLRPVVAPRTDN